MAKTAIRPLKLPANGARVRVANKALWNEARSPDRADFYTCGYEGRKTEEFFNLLVSVGVRSLLDIRFNPVSMYRPELSKSNLEQLARSFGIEENGGFLVKSVREQPPREHERRYGNGMMRASLNRISEEICIGF